MYELVWGEPGKFVKKHVFGENAPLRGYQAAYATRGLRQYQTESRRVQLGCSMSARGRDPGPILNARTEFGTIVTAAFTLRPTLSAPPFWRALLFLLAFFLLAG